MIEQEKPEGGLGEDKLKQGSKAQLKTRTPHRKPARHQKTAFVSGSGVLTPARARENMTAPPQLDTKGMRAKQDGDFGGRDPTVSTLIMTIQTHAYIQC